MELTSIDIDARSLVTSTIIEPGVVGLVNLGSTCYINSSVQCLNSFANFRDAMLHNVNTSALALPAITPFCTTSRTRGRAAQGRTEGGDEQEEEENSVEAEKDTEEKESEKEIGKGAGKGNGKGKGKSKESEKTKEADKGKGKGKGKKGKGKAKQEEVEEDSKGDNEDTEEGKPNKATTTGETTTQVAARVHDYVATFKAVLYSIWHSARGVDRSVLHGLRLASGYALDFKYFRNQHQDINEYLMHALEYLHTYDHRLLTASSPSKSETTDEKPKNGPEEPANVSSDDVSLTPFMLYFYLFIYFKLGMFDLFLANRRGHTAVGTTLQS